MIAKRSDPRGRPALYCSPACRVGAYRERVRERTKALEAAAHADVKPNLEQAVAKVLSSPTAIANVLAAVRATYLAGGFEHPKYNRVYTEMHRIVGTINATKAH